MGTGIIHGIDIDEYHAAPFVSSSKLRTFDRKGPRGFWLEYLYGTRNTAPRTDAMAVGQCFEDAVCGKPTHILVPEGMKLTTKAGKEWKAEQTLTVLGSQYAGLFDHGVRHVRENHTARDLIEASDEQVTLRREWDGIPGLQARPDWLCVGGCEASGWQPVAPDLKTTISLNSFGRSVVDYAYHVQAALVATCLQGADVTGSVHPLIVVEKASPYRCQVFWLSPEYVQLGAQRAYATLSRLAEHYESGEWPQTTEDSTTLEPPAWMTEGKAA